MNSPHVQVHDLGRIAYSDALEIQNNILSGLVMTKKSNREKPLSEREIPIHHLIFCEHDSVFTLGRTGKEENLLMDPMQLQEEKIAFYKTNRGGDITYHGPGQIVGYPIFDLEYFFTDVHKYVRHIEEGVIRTLADFGLEGKRIPGYTGVWLSATNDLPERKICAIGIHLSRWISMHGFALNVNTDLTFFNKIIPCGIADSDKEVTSISKELGSDVKAAEVKAKLLNNYAELFQFTFSLNSPLQS